VDAAQAMLEVIATDLGKSLVSLLVVGTIGSSCAQAACDGSLRNSVGWVASLLCFLRPIRMNVSEGYPMHDSSTIAANLSDAVVGKPAWPLINDIQSIFSVAR
jgi:hypothetical protein